MTLVLTWVTEYGIAMAADDALTETYGGHQRVLRGATKLIQHYGCKAGFGTWGAGTLPNQERGKNPIAIEFVVRYFLGEAVRVEAIDVLAQGLVERLNEFPTGEEVSAVDVAAYVTCDAERSPVVYRIANTDDPYADRPKIRRFSLQEVRKAVPYDSDADAYPIPGGHANAAFWVPRMMDGMTMAAKETEEPNIPGNDLEQRTTFLGVIARGVSNAFTRTNISSSIGPNITTLALPVVGDMQISMLS